MKALCIFVGLLLVAALIGGLFLADSELFSPAVRSADADRIRAEAEALRAETAARARERALALELERQEAEVELEALRQRRDRQAALVEPVAIAGMVTLVSVVLALTAAGCYSLVTRARSGPAGGPPGSGGGGQPRLAAPAGGPGASAGQRQLPAANPRNARPDTVSYEGLLAYCDEFIFHPNRARRCYAAGIEPWVEQAYHSLLVAARILLWHEAGGRWILRDRLGGIEDVARRISPEAFEAFVDAHLTPAVQPSIFGAHLGHEYQPASNYSRS